MISWSFDVKWLSSALTLVLLGAGNLFVMLAVLLFFQSFLIGVLMIFWFVQNLIYDARRLMLI